MKLDVVGFGALNIDRLYHVNKIAHEDEESYIVDQTESCGGSAANTIIGLSRLGNSTGFIGKVSADPEGSILLNNLQNENVDTTEVHISDNDRSGTVSGFVDDHGQRALYVDPGINDCIVSEDLNLDYINNSSILHLSSFVGKKYLESINTQKIILNQISNHVKLSFDPGRLYIERGIEFLDKFLTRTDILLINSSELGDLTHNINNSTKQDLIHSCDKLQGEYSIDVVVVKMGSKGSFVSTSNESQFVDAFNVNCVDTTGAGDAFNAGFLHSYIIGDDVCRSAVIGNFVASHCVTEYGATQGLPDISKLENLC